MKPIKRKSRGVLAKVIKEVKLLREFTKHIGHDYDHQILTWELRQEIWQYSIKHPEIRKVGYKEIKTWLVRHGWEVIFYN